VNPANGLAADHFAYSGPMTTDGNLKLAFFINDSGSAANQTMASLDLSALTPVTTVVFPNVVGSPVRRIRWGSIGLAFHAVNYNYSGTTPTKTGKIHLNSGTFVKAN